MFQENAQISQGQPPKGQKRIKRITLEKKRITLEDVFVHVHVYVRMNMCIYVGYLKIILENTLDCTN